MRKFMLLIANIGLEFAQRKSSGRGVYWTC
jgi:hypothetical protein